MEMNIQINIHSSKEVAETVLKLFLSFLSGMGIEVMGAVVAPEVEDGE